MKNLLSENRWDWKLSGVALALSFFLAVFLVKPIGVSTQFVILDGIIWNSVATDVVIEDSESKSGYASPNAYLNKSGGKYAKNVANPMNYSFIFVLSMIFGGFLGHLSSRFRNKDDEQQNYKRETNSDPCESLDTFTFKRFLLTFFGGFLVIIGARLAGGCTSGHMMSGMMQTSLSGYLFALGAFAVAVPTAMLIYKNKEV